MVSLSKDDRVGCEEQIHASVDKRHIERDGEEHGLLEKHNKGSSEDVLKSSLGWK